MNTLALVVVAGEVVNVNNPGCLRSADVIGMQVRRPPEWTSRRAVTSTPWKLTTTQTVM